MSGSNSPTVVVIDDTLVHYNTSRDASQAIKPSSPINNSVAIAKASPWNFSLAVITSPVSIWYNVTGYTRIAVYGAILQPWDLGVTAWANYTIDGHYTAANVTTFKHVVTDFPLFTSDNLDPNQQYNLTADIWASPEAPYLFDYLLAFSPPDPTPISMTGTTASSTSSARTVTVTASSSSNESTNIPHPIAVIGALVGVCTLFVALLLVALYCWCRSRGFQFKKIDTEEPMGPKPSSAPRPSVNRSATLVSTQAFGHTESFLEPPLPASSSVLAPTSSGLSPVPEASPAMPRPVGAATSAASSTPTPAGSQSPWPALSSAVLPHASASTKTPLGLSIAGVPSAPPAPTTSSSASAPGGVQPVSSTTAAPAPTGSQSEIRWGPDEYADCPPAYSS